MAFLPKIKKRREQAKRGKIQGQNLFTPPSVTRGVPHTVEGTQTGATGKLARAFTGGGLLARAIRKAAPRYLEKKYEERQAARRKIKSLPVIDDIRDRTRRRKEAARRRRGRASTVLNGRGDRRDTLG